MSYIHGATRRASLSHEHSARGGGIPDCDETECDETLTSLHLYTRTITNPNSDPLTTKRGLSIVGGYAFDNDHVPLATSRIAARCLNNIIVLAEPMRQVFVDEQYPHKVIERLKVLRFTMCRKILTNFQGGPC